MDARVQTTVVCKHCGQEIHRPRSQWESVERSLSTGNYVDCPEMYPYGGHEPA